MAAARVALLITIAASSLGAFACLFAPFADSGETLFETYARLDVVMSLACVALFLIGVLAAAGVARAKLDRVTIWLSAVPFAFFGAFVALEYWGEVEAASYVAAFLSALAAGSALALSLMARAAPDAALPAAVAAAPAAPEVAAGPHTSSPT